MPSNRTLFVALTACNFKNTIFDRLWAVHDCYVLQRRLLNDFVKVSNANEVMKTIIKSDEYEADEYRGQNEYDVNDADMEKYLLAFCHV